MPLVPRPLAAAAVVACVLLAGAAGVSSPPMPKPMSVHNRLLLNRLAVAGYRTVDVMLAVEIADFDRLAKTIGRRGGRVRRSERSVGYMRAEVPIDDVCALVDDSGVVAYQISSLSKRSWYRDGPPRSNAEMFRGFEVEPIVHAAGPVPARSTLPMLSPDEARAAGFTADDETGVGAWLASHPTFDGRGVTIAFLETAQPEFAHPTLRGAKAIDGRDVPKVAGIVDALDPDEPDETRVELTTRIHAVEAWHRVGGRTYILPAAGDYRFGVLRVPAGDNLVAQFGILRNDATGEIRVDTDGDADFRGEAPVADVNTRFEPRMLHLKYPRAADVSFVVADKPNDRQVHVYVARSGHQAMTVSVAAGGVGADGLASGVAPAARVLLVRNSSTEPRLHDFFEGYLAAAKRADVDVLTDSAGIMLVPDTSADFDGVFFNRLLAVYRKPIFHSAGNSPRLLNGVSPLGGVFAVGGSIGPAAFSALFGAGEIGGTLVHPLSTGGPALDGALKPDFLAPVHRLAADLMTGGSAVAVPKNAPRRTLPAGYRISCCTSASGPYAAGVAALLISAARQQRISWSVDTLGRALRSSAVFLPDSPAHQQGAGVLNVDGAWRELQRHVEAPRIRVRGDVSHALARYGADGTVGVGLFEREGWTPGSRGRRILRLTRESGPQSPITYRVSWTGNDGTFAASRSVTLPLGQPAAFPVDVSPVSSGEHSAILNLHDPETDAIVVRAATAIVAAEPIAPPAFEARFSGSVPLMRSCAHYVAVPADVDAIGFELQVVRGSLAVSILPSHGMTREYYDHVFPRGGRTFPKGRYTLLLPRPAAGTWSVTLTNDSAWREPDRGLISFEAADYVISIRVLAASVVGRVGAGSTVRVDAANHAAAITNALLQVSLGTFVSRRGDHLPTGLPNRFEIDVPPGASTLIVRVHAIEGSAVELHLYDCSSGECFSHDFTVPAANEHTLVVRMPSPGRWVAAVSPAPFPTARGRFVLDEIIGFDTRRFALESAGTPEGAAWTATIDAASAWPDRATRPNVLLCEIVDAAAEADARAHAWENRAGRSNLGDATVAAGMTVLRLR
jgi:subtilase family protein